MNVIRLSGGERGVVRWGYVPAATLEPWTLGEDGRTVRGMAHTINEMACGQAPLSFSTVLGRQTWRWPVEAITVDGMTVTLTVGALEVLR